MRRSGAWRRDQQGIQLVRSRSGRRYRAVAGQRTKALVLTVSCVRIETRPPFQNPADPQLMSPPSGLDFEMGVAGMRHSKSKATHPCDGADAGMRRSQLRGCLSSRASSFDAERRGRAPLAKPCAGL
jgi:hypothetical protein